MKIQKLAEVLIIVVFLLIMLARCGTQQAVQMVNELSFWLDGIKEVSISYDDENVSFFQIKNENLTIREYMSQDNISYRAMVTQSSDSIKVSEGGKPFFKDGFIRYIEVYLPASYEASLNITTTDGAIDLSDIVLKMNSLRIDCTSGTVKLNEVIASDIHLSSTSGKLKLGTMIADQIKIDVTQGDVVCKHIEGNVSYTSTNGNAEFLSAIGSGAYKVNNSGKLLVTYEEVEGDLFLYNKNDDIKLILPSALDFEFEAINRNGVVNIDVQGEFSVSSNITSGTVGSNPAVTVKVETKNGDIEVKR